MGSLRADGKLSNKLEKMNSAIGEACSGYTAAIKGKKNRSDYIRPKVHRRGAPWRKM